MEQPYDISILTGGHQSLYMECLEEITCTADSLQSPDFADSWMTHSLSARMGIQDELQCFYEHLNTHQVHCCMRMHEKENKLTFLDVKVT